MPIAKHLDFGCEEAEHFVANSTAWNISSPEEMAFETVACVTIHDLLNWVLWCVFEVMVATVSPNRSP